MVLYHDVEKVGRAVAPPATTPDGLPGIAPPRIDHVGLCAEDGPGSIRFMTEALGLHISEQIVDPEGNVRSAFIFAQNKTHDVVIGPGPNGRFHHVAFNVDDWDEVRRAARLLSESGRPLEVPPSQHGIARQNTIYFKDIAGNRLETATAGYLACPDSPPVTWTMQNIGRAMFSFGGPYDPAAFQQFI
jgi:catechol 2,3-dioxygenase